MKLKQSQIREIAQELEAGMKVFINRHDLVIKSILDWEEMIDDNDLWEEEYKKIETEWTDYVEIEKLESRESFKVMQDFAEKVDNNDMKIVLKGKSPFANFKAIVETSEYRNAWFEFRTLKHEEYVRKILEIENIEYE